MICYCVHKILPVDPIPRQMKPVHLTPHFPKIHLLSSHLQLGFKTGLISDFVQILSSPFMQHALLVSYRFDKPNILVEEDNFIHPPATSSLQSILFSSAPSIYVLAQG